MVILRCCLNNWILIWSLFSILQSLKQDINISLLIAQRNISKIPEVSPPEFLLVPNVQNEKM